MNLNGDGARPEWLCSVPINVADSIDMSGAAGEAPLGEGVIANVNPRCGAATSLYGDAIGPLPAGSAIVEFLG
jgi:hypothetical protein